MHGTGNDFVLTQSDRDDDPAWPELARQVCDRHFGVGADGLIFVLPSEVADRRMRIFNPDGSEAEMCGNGIRCFVKYVLDNGIVACDRRRPARRDVRGRPRGARDPRCGRAGRARAREPRAAAPATART